MARITHSRAMQIPVVYRPQPQPRSESELKAETLKVAHNPQTGMIFASSRPGITYQARDIRDLVRVLAKSNINMNNISEAVSGEVLVQGGDRKYRPMKGTRPYVGDLFGLCYDILQERERMIEGKAASFEHHGSSGNIGRMSEDSNRLY